MTKIFFIAILCYCLTSCSYLIMKAKGIKQPQVESVTSINRNATKNNIEEESLFVLKEDLVIPNMFTEVNKSYLFDKNGIGVNLSLVGANETCSGNILSLIKGLSKVTYAVRDSSQVLESEVNKAKHINYKKAPLIDPSADYYALYYWNSFAGKGNNKGMIERLRMSIEENRNVKIQLILINEDMIEGPDWEEKIIEYSKREGQVNVN